LPHLSISDVVVKKTLFYSKRSDAVREIFRVYHLLPHQGAELTPELMCVASCMPWAANPYLIASYAAAAEYEHGKLGAGYGVLSYGAVHDDLTAPSTRRWRM
jgi:hypothetical protein